MCARQLSETRLMHIWFKNGTFCYEKRTRCIIIARRSLWTMKFLISCDRSGLWKMKSSGKWALIFLTIVATQMQIILFHVCATNDGFISFRVVLKYIKRYDLLKKNCAPYSHKSCGIETIIYRVSATRGPL